jgi:hypothetical protein
VVAYVEHRGELVAVVADRRATRLVELGRTAEVAEPVEHLLFALRRLSLLGRGHPLAPRAAHALAAAADDVERRLLAPLALRGEGVVVVPTGGLHAVPWLALAGMRARRPVVAPSVARWLAHGAPADLEGGRQLLLVAGPDLAHADDEVASLHRLHGHGRVLGGPPATAGAVLAALAEADVAHIAAHGSFRADNPMFSSLRLSDGSLGVHDLELLVRLPHTVVLTACDAARSAVFAGDEVIGTAAALLGLGVATVVAPVLPVADAEAARFATAWHERVRLGEPAPGALAAVAAQAWADGDPPAMAASSSFLCVGTAASRGRIRLATPASVGA